MEKSRGVLTKLLIPQLLRVLEYQYFLLNNAKTYHVYQMIKYANYDIIIFMDIGETMRI